MHFGWVSLLQDFGSKMVVPILPLFLAVGLGASPAAIGLIDGVATVSASIAALMAGRFARRRPERWVRAGYGLSSLAKLALAAASAWPAVLGIRVADRAGKGIRDAPRDVLLAASPRHRHGRTFGVQQAMDKLGGFLGPLAGLAVYRASDGSFNAVFVAAFVPCAASVVLLWWIPPAGERSGDDRAESSLTAESTPVGAPRTITRAQRWALFSIGLHSLGFVSVSLLLLRALDADASVTEILLAYSGLRLVTAVASYPVGLLVDATSARIVTVIGMTIAAGAVATAAFADGVVGIALALAAVGLADAMTRGPVTAWLLSLGPTETATPVLGYRSAVTGASGLVSSVAVGATWGGSGVAPLLVAAAIGSAGATCASLVRPSRP